MNRSMVALVPILGLAGMFLLNQSCATKSALEEVEKDISDSKTNLKEAEKNLQDAKSFLSSAKGILESAENKLTTHLNNKSAHTPPTPTAEVEKTSEYKEVKVGWCDTLWDISSKVYDNSLYWPAIYNLNRDKVGSDPWILVQGSVLKYKAELTEEEKREAVKEAIQWDLKFKDRARSPKCPPK